MAQAKAAPAKEEKPIPEKEAGMMAEFEKAMGSDFVESKFLRERSIFFEVKPGALRKAVDWMKQEWGLYHCCTITGMDLQGKLAVIYHFEVKEVTVNLKVVIPTSKAEVDTITDLIPGANFYEREPAGHQVQRPPQPKAARSPRRLPRRRLSPPQGLPLPP